MNYKHIEASREARLWLGQIIIPAVGVVLMLDPQARAKAEEKLAQFKQKFKK